MIDASGNALEVTAARTGAAFDVLTLLPTATAKTYLKIDGTAEDVIIAALISGAAELLREDTGIVLGAEAWRVVMDQFPADGVIRVPVWPVRSITAITVADAAYTAATVSASVYDGVLTVTPALIVAAADGAGWPTVAAPKGGIVVTLAAGYENNGAVPAALVEILKLKVAALYLRGATGADLIEAAYQAAIVPWRVAWIG